MVGPTTDNTLSARHGFSQASEDALNLQINLELSAFYTYTAMTYYFKRDKIALFGFAKYFEEQAKEEKEHAEKFMEYLTTRGGAVKLATLSAPQVDFTSPVAAVEFHLKLEQQVTSALNKLHDIAESEKDSHLSDFTVEYLEDQYKSLKSVSDLLTNLQRAGGEGLGLFLFDKQLQ
eukprot:TRINITY_DN37_c0_g1_i1.p1 TRINITY_DN37_c0_g1~~TRINITY_DN37_c0_g1_i1.p1  ORF type:complete len:188 (-),score=57.34 TRINITY_DN37_c0_g1_i1:101-628(-)